MFIKFVNSCSRPTQKLQLTRAGYTKWSEGPRPRRGTDGHFVYPELCDVVPPGRRPEGAAERNEGLPARVEQKERAPSVSEGGVILLNVSLYPKSRSDLGEGFAKAVAGYSVLAVVYVFLWLASGKPL